MGKTWTLKSWHNLVAEQQPDWGDTETYNKVILTIESCKTKSQLEGASRMVEIIVGIAIIANIPST